MPVTKEQIEAEEAKVIAARDALLQVRKFVREAVKNGDRRHHSDHWGTLGVNLSHLGKIATEMARELGTRE